MNFKGVFPILATPFRDDESLDLESMRSLVRFMRAAGVDGVTVLGVLGEANRLTDAERERVIEAAVSAAQGLPVIVGASAGGTLTACELARMAQSAGAAAVMVTPQADPALTEERIVELFSSIARAASVPIVLQDHPASSQVSMPASLILRIVREVPAVACIKEEAVPTPPKIRALIEGMRERRVAILTGLGALYGQFDLEAGSDGFNTGFAFPEALMAMTRAARAGQWETVRAIYSRFLPLIVFEQQPGVGVRKEILRLRGAIAGSRVRHPGAGIAPAVTEQLRRLLDAVLPGEDLTRPLKI